MSEQRSLNKPPRNQYEIAVIGAGVMGLGTAWRLADRGHDVVVIDRESAGFGASRAAAGMLAPTAEVEFWDEAPLRLQSRSLERYPDFIADVENSSGMGVDYRREGTLVVARDRDEDESIERVFQFQKRLDLPVKRLSAAELKEFEPRLSAATSAVFIPSDHQLDSWKLVDALIECLGRAGGTLIEHNGVDDLIGADEGAVERMRLDSGDEIAVDKVVVSAGAWSSQFDNVPELDQASIRPVRGEAVSIEDADPSLCNHVLRCPEVYLAPKSEGSIVVGATSEERGFDSDVTAGGVLQLLWEAWKLLPAIDEQPLMDVWCGFRPVTLDRMPLIGASRLENLFLNTGHGRHGILLAPISIEIAVKIIENGETGDQAPQLHPGRFA